MTDSVNPSDGTPERRRVHRVALRLNATIREPGRSRVGVRVIDISTHGCRIESNAGVSADSWLLLSIAGLETQYCRTAWCCEEFAGLEFSSALAEPILQRLIDSQKHLSETSISDLREIAARTSRLATKDAGFVDETLAEFSRKCAEDAVVEGLRLGDARHVERRNS